MHVSEDGVASPLELVSAAFYLFKDDAFQCIFILLPSSITLMLLFLHRLIKCAIWFKELHPFINVTAAPHDHIYVERFKHHIMWQGQNWSVLFTMLGSVQSCNIVQLIPIGQHVYKAITVIPYGKAWRKFHVFLGKLYGEGQMCGPFEYGCLLTLSSRCEGYSSGGMHVRLSSYTSSDKTLVFLFGAYRFVTHVEACHSQKEHEGLWWLRFCSIFRVV